MADQLTKAINILNLINSTAPAISQLILTIRHTDGTEATLDLLSEADSQYLKNLKEIADRKSKEEKG